MSPWLIFAAGSAVAAIWGFIGYAIVVWHRESKELRARAEYNAAARATRNAALQTKTAGDLVRAQGREEADRILAKIPLEPEDDEAWRLLREAEERLARAKKASEG